MTNLDLIARALIDADPTMDGYARVHIDAKCGAAAIILAAFAKAGRVIVPREPTDEMIASGYDVCRGHVAVRHIYRAMIAAGGDDD